MRAQPRDALFTTAITEAELLYGLALLPDGRRKKALERAVAEALAVDLAGVCFRSTARPPKADG